MAARKKRPLRRGKVSQEEIQAALQANRPPVTPRMEHRIELPSGHVIRWIGPNPPDPEKVKTCSTCGEATGSRLKIHEDDPWECLECFQNRLSESPTTETHHPKRARPQRKSAPDTKAQASRRTSKLKKS